MSLELNIQEEISNALNALFDTQTSAEELILQPTRKEFEGTYTFVTFPFLRVSKMKPEDTGEAIGEKLLQTSSSIIGFNVVKGFLNLVISDEAWLKSFSTIWSLGESIGKKEPSGNEVMVEYSSPNTNKPLHLGHLRNNFLGNSVSRILEANGNKVHKVQIINDRGIHICKSMLAWKKFGNDATPQSSGLKGDKLVGNYYVEFETHYRKEVNQLVEEGLTKEVAEKEAPMMKEAQAMLLKWEAKDPEVYNLWKTMNGWVYKGFEETYKTMGVDFDQLYFESETFLLGKDEVLKGLDQDIFYQKDDKSIWVDLTDEGLDHKILLRSDGTSVYMTQDIGTAIMRYREYPKINRQVYTVGNEQEYHFKVLFLILKKLGYRWAEECFHLSYGMVDLPTGKMKSREGTVVDADDLMQEMFDTAAEHTKELGKIEGFTDEQAGLLYKDLGLGALKYYLLKVDPKKRMLFDPNESIQFHGNTGPFIQYVYARISAILRKAEEMNVPKLQDGKLGTLKLHSTEREVIYMLSQFENRVSDAAKDYSPAIIAQYVFDLAKEYNRFYAEVQIFGDDNAEMISFRIAFCEIVSNAIKNAMVLLGINVPERM